MASASSKSRPGFTDYFSYTSSPKALPLDVVAFQAE